MDMITLLPADSYQVINNSILTDFDRKILVSLYEPIVGPYAISLYLTLWHDLEQSEIFSRNLSHHHLMSILKSNLTTIKTARESIEALGLIKTYFRPGDVNEYIYELYSPLTPSEFFNHPILNIVLYNNIGREEYDRLKLFYQKSKFNTKDYVEITKTLSDVYESSPYINNNEDIKGKVSSNLSVQEQIDFDTLISSMPKGVINERAFNKKTRELINLLAFIYDIDTIKMSEILRTVLNEFGMIDKTELRIATRKCYQFNNNSLPTLVYRSQPEYLKEPVGDNSMRGKIIAYFDNTSPYDFLRNKNRGTKPTSRDLKTLEILLIDMELSPSVVNVLIDYVLRKNNNKFVQAYVETIASQWKRANLKTAKEAMDFAEKEHKKLSKKKTYEVKKEIKKPIWFNDKVSSEEVSKEEEEELKELLKEFN